MKILAVDTSTEACSTAVYINGEIIERFAFTPRKHIEALMPMVKEVMNESEIELSDLDGLAFGAGPGSFAGLRVACSFIQGLGSGLALPIVPVSTLAALAFQVLEDHHEKTILAALDAKMNEVYWGIYQRNEKGIIALINDQIGKIDSVPSIIESTGDHLIGVGEGWKLLTHWQATLMPHLVLDEQYPRAGEVALLAVHDLEMGLGLFADQVSPMYLRENIALTIDEQKTLRAQKESSCG